MKVLVVNQGHTDNIGDMAINHAIISELKKRGYNVDFSPFTGQFPASITSENKSLGDCWGMKARRWLKKKAKWVSGVAWFVLNIRRIFLASKLNYDYILIGGGQLILSNGIFPVALFTWSLVFGLKKTKIILAGVGVGEDFSFIDKKMIKFAIDSCDRIIVRDGDSAKKINHFFKSRVQEAPDLAFLLSNKSFFCDKKSLKIISVGVIAFEVHKKYCKELNARCLTKREYFNSWIDFISKNFIESECLCFLSSTREDVRDSMAVFSLARKVFKNKKIVFFDYDPNLEKYMNMLSQSEAILSGRMHSLILGQLLGLKVFPWVISCKIKSYQSSSLCKDPVALKRELSKILDDIFPSIGMF